MANKVTQVSSQVIWGYDALSVQINQGDSGGPLVYRNTAVGIASFIQPDTCDKPHAPNVFAKISEFLPWIRSVIGNAEPVFNN
ncbi:hypothetical protein NFI96_024390 [Prochilodus magdalenae]|nr:hypothetical protein NFI96_024390 [Prochilodus magdalenae]